MNLLLICKFLINDLQIVKRFQEEEADVDEKNKIILDQMSPWI